MTNQTANAEVILAAKGPGKLRLSEVASASGVSRSTLYRWFATKDELFTALSEYERAQFDEGLSAEIEAHRTPARRVNAAYRFVLTYLDESMGEDSIGVDPAFTLPSLNESLTAHVETLVWLLGPSPGQVPAIETKSKSRAEAAEMFMRVAYSRCLVHQPDTEDLLTLLRSLTGLARRGLARGVG